jgi:Na+-driven multidrug efflux pump
LGMALAEPLLLSRPPEIAERLAARRPAMLAAALGMLSFGIAHIIVAVLNGLNLTQVPLLAPMGFVAGLGLSLVLYAQPRTGWHVGILR